MYDKLEEVLEAAFKQASEGKGRERHANGASFEDQHLLQITRTVGAGFPHGQAMKKMLEADMMAGRGEFEAARAELLGAIVYLAALIIYIEECSRNAT